MDSTKRGTAMEDTKDLEMSTASKRDRFYTFLNSNFFIWFLSSIVLSGGASLYHYSQRHYEQAQSQKKEVMTYQFEIINRLSHMHHLIRRSNTIEEAQSALSNLVKNPSSVTPEFQNATMAALYFKQYQLNEIEDNQNNQNFRDLEEMYFNIATSNPKSNFNTQDKEKILKLIDDLKKYEKKISKM